MADEAVGIAVGVEDGEEVRRELAVGVFEREVLLVVAHDGDQDFGGQREILGIEAAENYRGTLGQVDNRVEQGLVFAPARAGNRAGGGVEGLADAVLALGGGGGDEVLRQRGGVVGGLVDFDGAAGEDAMAFAGVAGGDASEFDGDDLVVEEGDHPADGADEALGGFAAPVHALGPVDSGDFLGQQFGQDFAGGAAFLLDGGGEVFALGVGDFFQRGDGDSGLSGEGFGGRSGHAILKGNLEGWAGKLLLHIGLLGRDIARQNGDATGRGERFDGGIFGQPLASEQVSWCGAKVRRAPRRSCGREFLRYRSQAGSLTLIMAFLLLCRISCCKCVTRVTWSN